jgi:hypothetical protein
MFHIWLEQNGNQHELLVKLISNVLFRLTACVDNKSTNHCLCEPNMEPNENKRPSWSLDKRNRPCIFNLVEPSVF